MAFPTTATGYRTLLAWLRSFGVLSRVEVEGTGSYGVALSRHLTSQGVQVIEVARPNRQVRRRYGKTDVVDAIAAARAVMSGEASATPKSHDGEVEALRTLKVLLRSVNKSRHQAVNQLHNSSSPHRTSCAPSSARCDAVSCWRPARAFRIAADDDSLAGTTRFVMRDLAQRILEFDGRHSAIRTRMSRLATTAAPQLLAIKGVGPDVASTLLLTAGDNPERLGNERALAALCGVNRSRPAAARPNGTASTEMVTDKPTRPSGAS